MKVTSIELHPENSSQVAVLSFRDPGRLNPLNVKSIEGLDAEELVHRFYGGTGSRKFYNLSLERREPVFRIGLNPRFGQGESYASLRDSLYRIVASSRTGVVQVQFKNGDDVVAALSGLVRGLEAPQFEKTQEVVLSLKCDDPMLRALTPAVVDVEGLDPLIPNIEDPLSTAPHGFKFSMSFLDDLSTFYMEDPNEADWSFTVDPSTGFLEGDVLHFSSEHNDKYLYVVRGGDTIHLADAIVSGSMWPIIFPGDNTFFIINNESVAWETISHYPTYWGV